MDKNHKGWLGGLVALMMLVVCQPRDPYQKQTKGLQALLAKYGKGEVLEQKAYLVTIEGGCGGCIAVTNQFISGNLHYPGWLAIACTRSRKSVNLAFDHSVRQHQQFVHDSLQLARQVGLVEGHSPMLFWCQAGRVVAIDELTYQNSQEKFRKLKAELAQP
jgi:hypothetical protein